MMAKTSEIKEEENIEAEEEDEETFMCEIAKVTIEEYLQFADDSTFDDIIDVRTSQEYSINRLDRTKTTCHPAFLKDCSVV